MNVDKLQIEVVAKTGKAKKEIRDLGDEGQKAAKKTERGFERVEKQIKGSGNAALRASKSMRKMSRNLQIAGSGATRTGAAVAGLTAVAGTAAVALNPLGLAAGAFALASVAATAAAAVLSVQLFKVAANARETIESLEGMTAAGEFEPIPIETMAAFDTVAASGQALKEILSATAIVIASEFAPQLQTIAVGAVSLSLYLKDMVKQVIDTVRAFSVAHPVLAAIAEIFAKVSGVMIAPIAMLPVLAHDFFKLAEEIDDAGDTTENYTQRARDLVGEITSIAAAQRDVTEATNEAGKALQQQIAWIDRRDSFEMTAHDTVMKNYRDQQSMEEFLSESRIVLRAERLQDAKDWAQATTRNVGIMANSMNSVAEYAESRGSKTAKVLFGVSKGLAAAQSIIQGILLGQQALRSPPEGFGINPLGFITAGVMVAGGVANAALIMSQSVGGGGGGGGGGGLMIPSANGAGLPGTGSAGGGLPGTMHSGGNVLAPDEAVITARHGEAVLSSVGVDMLGGPDAINGLNRGDGSAQPIVIVQKYRQRMLGALMQDAARMGGPVRSAIRDQRTGRRRSRG